ncbi:MAG TPA: PH domain-containing protein [Magnetospirillaceae bacterium]|nr:PH domain-containing protein [Magnetospirillaceae bacterium]
MSYVESHLIPNETVLYITRLSRIVYLKAVFVILVGLGFAGWAAQGPDSQNPLYAVAGLAVLVGLTLFLVAFIRRQSSEFAVTDKRVIVKVGLFSRRSIELLLTKVEAITVDQTLWGRIFGYGSITIIGTGGTKEPFHLIGDPLEFRRQSQIAATS